MKGTPSWSPTGWGSREPRRKPGTVSRHGLVVLAKLEALRAGGSLVDHGDEVELRSLDGELSERLTLRDACAVLAMMRGVHCSPHVLKAGGVKIVRP